jgi:hypothetical protein
MAMAGGDTVMVQPTPLEPLPALPMAARTMAIIPIETATTPTVATDAFWFATNNHELGLIDFVMRTRLGFADARDGERFVNRSCTTSKRTLALRQRVELVGTVDNGVGRTWDSISCSTNL